MLLMWKFILLFSIFSCNIFKNSTTFMLEDVLFHCGAFRFPPPKCHYLTISKNITWLPKIKVKFKIELDFYILVNYNEQQNVYILVVRTCAIILNVEALFTLERFVNQSVS